MNIPAKFHLRATSLIAVVVLTTIVGFVLFGVHPSSNSAASNTPTPQTTSIANPTIANPTSVSLPATVSATPSTAPTAIATRTPLPPPSPAPTTTPQSTSIPPTPIPPSSVALTGWLTYQSPSGFSFTYPPGWEVQEVPPITIPAYGPDPQISISLANFSFLKPTGRSGLPPGGFKMDITDHQSPFPPGGTQKTVGPQQFPGQSLVYYRPNFEGTQSLERMISIYFTAGKRQWAIAGYFSPPTNYADQNTAQFYQIVGSLRYGPK